MTRVTVHEKDRIMNIPVMPDKKRTRYHHGDLRAQLIEATRELVEEKGPDHFSVSEACRRAQVSTAAPYKHFKDKTEMLREVAMQGMERHASEMMAEVAPHPDGTLDRVIAMGRVYVRFAKAEPGVFRLMFTWGEDPEGEDILQQQGERVKGFVKMEVAKCLSLSEINEDVERRALMLWSFVHGLSFLSIDGKLQDERMAEDIEALLVDVSKRMVPEAS